MLGRPKIVVVIGVIGALSVAIGTITVAVASTTTTANVQSLEAAEAHVASLLHSYSDTPTWKTAYKAALATQASDITKVNADLYPPVPAKPSALSWSTSGTLV